MKTDKAKFDAVLRRLVDTKPIPAANIKPRKKTVKPIEPSPSKKPR